MNVTVENICDHNEFIFYYFRVIAIDEAGIPKLAVTVVLDF